MDNSNKMGEKVAYSDSLWSRGTGNGLTQGRESKNEVAVLCCAKSLQSCLTL